jgi:CheY-like chemotaxis protein/anti-sigma regulatory factor (Ser/Thr protein kinase)
MMRGGQTEVSKAEPKKKIFVVEDEDELRNLLLELFEKEGYDATGASDGGVAQDLLDQNHFDLLLLDLLLPTVGGLEIFQRLQKRPDRPKVIVMTGVDTTETILQLVKGQACQLITKPAARSTYLEAVQHAFAETCKVMPIEVVSAKADWIELLVPCQLEVADRLQSFMLGLNAKLSKEVRESMAVAFRELLVNAIEWGGKLDPSRKVRIACLRSARILQYRIQDPGPGFKPDDLKHAAINNDPEHPYEHMAARREKGLRPGGFGLLMTHTLVDELIYNEAHNEVVFIKYL